MTTRKITAFLMCPAANGDASGGTPAASAASGGHIKKGAWVSAHDAALLGLAQVIPGPLSRALPYCYENKADEHVEREERPEEFVRHRSVLALVAPLLIHGALQAGVSDGDEKEQRTDASHQGADDAQQVEEEVAHGSGPDGRPPLPAYDGSSHTTITGRSGHALSRDRRERPPGGDIHIPLHPGMENRNHHAPGLSVREAGLVNSRLSEDRAFSTARSASRISTKPAGVVDTDWLSADCFSRGGRSADADTCGFKNALMAWLVRADWFAYQDESPALCCVASHCDALIAMGAHGPTLTVLHRWRRVGVMARISGLGLLLGAQALQLAVACLRQHNQFLTERESRFGGCPLQKIADGHLAATADLRDLGLAKTALLNA